MASDKHRTTAPVDPAAPLVDETYVLVGINGGFLTYPAPRVGTLSVGRSESCDIRIDHPTVSRRHIELEFGDQVRVRDLGGANGTTVLGARLADRATCPVGTGESIGIGAATLMVQRSSLPNATPARSGQRYVHARLREECARAARTKGNFSFALLRVRGGATAGRVETVLAAELRVADVVAAASPTEHELILVDVSPSDAQAVVDRIRDRLRSAEQHALIALAHFPGDGTTPERLAAEAHARLRLQENDAFDSSPTPPWRRLVEQVADSHLSVLIRGETGVGKELCAAELHRRSSRSAGPLLKLNCAAFSEALLESELFGHERGAFTGAVGAKPGLLETADGGTVFLDEVGDLPMPLQAKLLRVLEDGEFLRVGSVQPRRVDVRFVSATNRPLEADIEARRFRRDLLYRLGAVTIEVPPLRERTAELPGLVKAFCASAARQMKRSPVPSVSRNAMALLRAHPWPGNIRELRNAIERAVLLCGDGPIEPLHLPMDSDDDADTLTEAVRQTQPMTAPDVPRAPNAPPQTAPRRAHRASLNDELAEVERRQIVETLAEFGGNQTLTAEKLGIARGTLRKRMDAYGLSRPKRRRRSPQSS